jgi:hypothetical protein
MLSESGQHLSKQAGETDAVMGASNESVRSCSYRVSTEQIQRLTVMQILYRRFESYKPCLNGCSDYKNFTSLTNVNTDML